MCYTCGLSIPTVLLEFAAVFYLWLTLFYFKAPKFCIDTSSISVFQWYISESHNSIQLGRQDDNEKQTIGLKMLILACSYCMIASYRKKKIIENLLHWQSLFQYRVLWICQSHLISRHAAYILVHCTTQVYWYYYAPLPVFQMLYLFKYIILSPTIYISFSLKVTTTTKRVSIKYSSPEELLYNVPIGYYQQTFSKEISRAYLFIYSFTSRSPSLSCCTSHVSFAVASGI